MKLAFSGRTKATISLVPLVDVMLILLIFFMVTSTYLNLDMVPVVDRTDDTSVAQSGGSSGGGTASTMLLRLTADGQTVFRGRALSTMEVTAQISERLADAPETAIVVLPSGGASMQSLVSLMEAASAAGAGNLRVMRLEARP